MPSVKFYNVLFQTFWNTWQKKKNNPRTVVDNAGIRFSLFFVYTGANFALLELTLFFDPLFCCGPLSDPFSDPEPGICQWNGYPYVGYVLPKLPANTPKNGLTGLFVMPNHRS